MKHFAVIGDPIDHSRSPRIYEELFRKHSIDADFIRLRVKKEEIVSVRELTRGLSGFAVTMPHKQSIIPFLDELDPSASECGAVNIVSVRNGALIGYNTDGLGLADAAEEAGFIPVNKKAVILGRGGVAKAAAHELERRGCGVTFLVRSIREGSRFREVLISDFNEKTDLFINATPLGMMGSPEYSYLSLLDAVRPELVIDMVYRTDGPTKLVSEARGRGINAVDGSRMLYLQAIRAFRIFTGMEA